MKILETERLLLRGLEQGDFKDVCKLLQDDEVMYAYEGAFNDQEVQNWLDRQFGRYRHDGFGLWGVVEKGSNELIGQCGITYQEFDGKRVPEIGYLFKKEFWHKGFAIEAAVACREYAFHTLGFEEVYSIIRDTNIASQKVARAMACKKWQPSLSITEGWTCRILFIKSVCVNEKSKSDFPEQNRSDNDYIKKPFAFLRSVCDERTFSFYLVDLLKEYCFIE